MTRLLGLLGLLLLVQPLAAEEVIEQFHSDIRVHRNGDVEVTEMIRVRAEGRAIRRGIYRDFPTRYRNAHGADVTVGFKVLAVQRNGRSEPYRVANRSNGKRVYIGDENVYLDPGVHEYWLSYLTTRQLGFFDEFDELYWNVTGNDWAFPILQASARVSLPAMIDDLRLTGYTGPQGSTRQDLIFRQDADGSAHFETLDPLGRKEGLTIVVGWPKGIVDEASATQRRTWFWEDNRASLLVIAGATALLVYYLMLWRMFGRDPEAGVIVPQYRPPKGYSPASMRYVENMGYDKKCFTAAVINLGVKGELGIEDKHEDFRLVRQRAGSAPLAPGEKQVLRGLFGQGRKKVDITQTNRHILTDAIRRHKRSLKLDFEKKYFNTNAWILVPGILFTLILAGNSVASLGSDTAIFGTLLLLAILLMPLLMLAAIVRGLKRFDKQGKIQVTSNLFALAVFAVAINFEFSIEKIVADVPLLMVAGIVAMLITNYLFYQWLKAPTAAGRQLLDRLEGFKHYLQVAEEDEIAQQGAPTFSRELYESYLPYAIALGLENEWNARLDRAISSGLVDRSYTQPGWFRSYQHGKGDFASALAGSFDSAIAAATVAPGSSSGSSGGSSGGGGGGGGGGGW